MSSTSTEDGFVELPGGRFHYRAWGDPSAPPLVMLHGFNQTAHSWDEVAPALALHRRAVALTQRGHGSSHRDAGGDYSREAMVADVDQLATHLGFERFDLMGMSMGATHALGFAAEHSARVGKLVVVDYAPRVEKAGIDKIKFMVMRRWDSFDDAVREVMRFNPRRSEANIRARLEHTTMQQPDGKWTWCVDPAFALQSRFAERPEAMWQVVRQVACPTLVVRGAQSDVLSDEAAAAMVDALADGRLTVVTGAGHSVPGDNPAGFTDAVVAFLDAG